MSQNEEQIVSHVDPSFKYIEHPGGFIMEVPKSDEIVVLGMLKSHYETLIRTYNDKMITNSKTRKGAKDGKIPNPTINGFNFIINNAQSAKMMQNPESVKNLYVSDQDYFNRIITPSSRSKGSISPVQAGKLTAPVSLLSNFNPIVGIPMVGNPLVFPPGYNGASLLSMQPLQTIPESSEHD